MNLNKTMSAIEFIDSCLVAEFDALPELTEERIQQLFGKKPAPATTEGNGNEQ